MSIDLGSSPTPPAASPNETEAGYIRTAIGAVEQSPNDTIMYVRKQQAYQSLGVVQILTATSLSERHLLDVLPAYWERTSDAYTMAIGAGIQLEANALHNCPSLQSIEIHDCVIPDWFCTYNPLLLDVYIYNCPYIGAYAFVNNGFLSSAYVDAQYIYEGAFAGTTLTSLTLVNVVEIGTSAFSQTDIGLLETPPSCFAIGNYAFSDCGSIYDIQLNEGLNTIGEYAFQAVSGVGSLTIPSTVTYIGTGAFELNGLTYLRVNALTPPTVGTDVFASGSLTAVSVPYTPEWVAVGGSWAGLTVNLDAP